MPSPERHTKTTHPLLDLVAHHPKCFNWDNPRPLKLKLHKDLVVFHMQYVTLPEGANKDKREAVRWRTTQRVKEALALYCTRPAYLESLVPGAVRIDHHGQPAGFVTELEAASARAVLRGEPPPERPPFPITPVLPEDAQLQEENIVSGSLELTVKFSQLPTPVPVKTGMKVGFRTESGLIETIILPKSWKKLARAAQEYPQWAAVLTGKLGGQSNSAKGPVFVLVQPACQIYEKKPKAKPKAAPAPAG